MGYLEKTQQITRKNFNEYYTNFPRAIAMVVNSSKSDPVELEIVNKDTLNKVNLILTLLKLYEIL